MRCCRWGNHTLRTTGLVNIEENPKGCFFEPRVKSSLLTFCFVHSGLSSSFLRQTGQLSKESFSRELRISLSTLAKPWPLRLIHTPRQGQERKGYVFQGRGLLFPAYLVYYGFIWSNSELLEGRKHIWITCTAHNPKRSLTYGRHLVISVLLGVCRALSWACLKQMQQGQSFQPASRHSCRMSLLLAPRAVSTGSASGLCKCSQHYGKRAQCLKISVWMWHWFQKVEWCFFSCVNINIDTMVNWATSSAFFNYLCIASF